MRVCRQALAGEGSCASIVSGARVRGAGDCVHAGVVQQGARACACSAALQARYLRLWP